MAKCGDPACEHCGHVCRSCGADLDVTRDGLDALRAVLLRLRWDDQGGFSSYLGEGRWSFVSTGLTPVSPDELNALLALAGIVPDQIVPKGTCATCAYAVNGCERGYAPPCLTCKRPVMSNWEAKP